MSLRFGILTLSDRSARGERPDTSGVELARLVQSEGWSVAKQVILPDNESAIRANLIGTNTILPLQWELVLLVVFMFVMLWIGTATFRSLERRVRTLGTLGQH